MCLILFALNEHPDYPLVLAANRDEFLARPTAPAGRWADGSGLLAGRDLMAGGTWLAVSEDGRLAAVTNVREPGRRLGDARSRGELVVQALQSDGGEAAYLASLDGDAYNGFNLIAYDGERIHYVSNRGTDGVVAVENGLHGLSNAAMDTPWPKVVHGREDLQEAIARVSGVDPDPAPILNALASRDIAADDDLPDTGVGLELERALSPPFIRSNGYGTRSSTVVFMHREGWCLFVERTYPRDGQTAEDRIFRITFQMTGSHSR